MLSTMTVAVLVSSAGPAAAATKALTLTTYGSTNTSIGYQAFANVNFGGTTVTPSGKVTFRLYRPTDPSCTSPVYTSTVAVNGTSINSPSWVTNQAGTYRWTTSYSGDATYYPVAATPCTAVTADVLVSKARNVMNVTAQPLTNGQLKASATLTGYSPTGSITYQLTNTQNCTGTPLLTVSVPVNSGGPTLSSGYRPTVGGTYRWRASYAGDANNQGSSISACFASNNSVVYTP
ncbi:MAG: hypothetical protein QOD63_2980 [Actinomycetota bacterium]|jgi:hypothetical protein|nr:hypothetical protein [Actinomycetota bacterium]